VDQQSMGRRRPKYAWKTPTPFLSDYRSRLKKCTDGVQRRKDGDWKACMGIIIALAVFLAATLGRAFSAMATDELKAWVPWITEWLVKRAVAVLPEERRERFEEEWRSHLDDVPGQIGKLIVALGLLTAAQKMSLILRAESEQDLLGKLLKRSIDVMVSAIFLVLLAPAFAFVAMLIKLNGSGPIFVARRRKGANGKTFEQYSFRTLQLGVDGTLMPQRIVSVSRLGEFLRRTSLDELPQLFNVLRGEMTLVGPRPKRPDDGSLY